ncbi:hypothetical protein ABZ738_05565 [Micromonospora sp. NPDC047793]|uniref:hypothetical protein n=1 Tax=Micromonospora sp. NPDC047793 TaxID=3154342 RepID=UPI0033E753B2
MITIDGREWGTPAELAAALGADVTEAMVRRWRDRKGLTTRAGYSPLDETARIERATRLNPRGRPRRLDAGQPAA